MLISICNTQHVYCVRALVLTIATGKTEAQQVSMLQMNL